MTVHHSDTVSAHVTTKRIIKTDNPDLYRDPIEEDYKQLEDWLIMHGADLSNIVFKKSESTEGFGIYAKQSISANGKVAYIPSTLIISEHTALQSPLGQAFTAFNKTISDPNQYGVQHVCTKTILCLYLVHQYFCLRKQSPWFPYLRALPRSFDTPLFWTPNQLKWLSGTNLHYVVQEKRTELEHDFFYAKSIIETNLSLQTIWPNRSDLTLANFVWARTVCSSRAFPSDLNHVVQGRAVIKTNDDETHMNGMDLNGEFVPCKCHLALWPLFDMLNHRRGQSMIWDSTQNHGMTFVTGTEIHANEEIFNSYGPKGNDELLLSYGFCLDITNHPDDYFPIKLNLGQDPLYDVKLTLLKSNSLLPYKQLYLLRLDDPVPSHLVAAVRVLVSNQPEIQALNTSQLSIHFVSTRNELTVWETLGQLLSAKQHALQNIDHLPTENNSYRARMASIYRTGQLDIINRAQQYARTHLQTITNEYVDTHKVLLPSEVLNDQKFLYDTGVQQLRDAGLIRSNQDVFESMAVYAIWISVQNDETLVPHHLRSIGTRLRTLCATVDLGLGCDLACADLIHDFLDLMRIVFGSANTNMIVAGFHWVEQNAVYQDQGSSDSEDEDLSEGEYRQDIFAVAL